jgi:hypothetical protein
LRHLAVDPAADHLNDVTLLVLPEFDEDRMAAIRRLLAVIARVRRSEPSMRAATSAVIG